jgi:hypothetical protein
MAKKTKTKVSKSEERYGTTFSSAVWQADGLSIVGDRFTTTYNPYNDSTAADNGDDPLPGAATLKTTINADCDATAKAAIVTAISGLTDDEKLATLGCSLLDELSAIHVADADCVLYGGTVV